MSEGKATLRPWYTETSPASGLSICGEGHKIARPLYFVDGEDVEEVHANAELIVRAVNNHEALVEALRQTHEALMLVVRALPVGADFPDYSPELDTAERASLACQAALAEAGK